MSDLIYKTVYTYCEILVNNCLIADSISPVLPSDLWDKFENKLWARFTSSLVSWYKTSIVLFFQLQSNIPDNPIIHELSDQLFTHHLSTVIVALGVAIANNSYLLISHGKSIINFDYFD